jgi:hypothetical protein
LLGRLRRERRRRRPPGRGASWAGAPAHGDEPCGAPLTLGRGPRGRRRRGLMALPRFGAGSVVGDAYAMGRASCARLDAVIHTFRSFAVTRLQVSKHGGIVKTRWTTIGLLASSRDRFARILTSDGVGQRGDPPAAWSVGRTGTFRLSVPWVSSEGVAALSPQIRSDVQRVLGVAQPRWPECHGVSAIPSRWLHQRAITNNRSPRRLR